MNTRIVLLLIISLALVLANPRIHHKHHQHLQKKGNGLCGRELVMAVLAVCGTSCDPRYAHILRLNCSIFHFSEEALRHICCDDDDE